MKSIRARAPAASSLAVRRVMQANVGHETAPEVRLRSALHRSGLRFRKDARLEIGIRCKADVVFVRARVCVFVDGCFWHGCALHFEVPKSNSAWWREKIEDNIRRDRRQTDELTLRGWTVLRIWEHELLGSNLSKVLQRIGRKVQRAQKSRR
jgi:DNA mismatch endonuclease, patch repair protein